MALRIVSRPTRARFASSFALALTSGWAVSAHAQTAPAAEAPIDVDAGPAPPAPPAAPIDVDASGAIDVDAGAPDVGGAAPATRGDEPGGPPSGEPSEPVPQDVQVRGRRATPPRGASDYRADVGQLAAVPRKNATALLQLAPGFFLTNEGGDGHAERIYLRGFDAREGQDVEVSVGGVPVNEAGNPHGNGFADLHFVIPETVRAVRILEGPFDPRQGNYAVAGSVDYELGVERRGVMAKGSYGSFGTARALGLWAPEGESLGTFGAVEVGTTDGFGENRDAQHASAFLQYEHPTDTGSYRISTGVYGTDYHSAGLLREDDVARGRKGFYDTYDTNQGGDVQRFHVAEDVETKIGDAEVTQQTFAIVRSMRLRENFTGFLLDVQEPEQNPHAQRGDLLDTTSDSWTLGGRGSGRWHTKLFDRRQEIELGTFARFDRVEARRQRVGAQTNAPYATESNLDSRIVDIGLWADAALRPLPLVVVRGGVRADFFGWDVDDLCAVQSVSKPDPNDPPGDQSCLDQQRFGVHREPNQRSNTSGIQPMPRVSTTVGPVRGFQFSAAYGQGVRSIDPTYITQDAGTPFASIDAWDGGITYSHSFLAFDLEASSVFFVTHVDRDLVFSETEGRNVLGGGTTRAGYAGALRLRGSHFDASANVTAVRSRFDDTGLLVPYVPDVVGRLDGAVFFDVTTIAGSSLRSTSGLGSTFVGARALPHDARSDVIFTTDLSTSMAWRFVEVGVSCSNLLDLEYRLAEYDFSSDFNSAPAATLVPTKHFAAGAPRTFLGTITLTWGSSS